MSETPKVVPGTEVEYKIVATVKSVERATEGYGDNLRVVGVKVSASYVLEIEGENVDKDLNFVLPLQLRRFALPGDKITLVVAQTGEIGWG